MAEQDRWSAVRWVGRGARRAVVSVAGGVVVLVGVVMLFTPGPGLAATAAGLAILGTEYHWARQILTKVRSRSRATYARARARLDSRRPR